MMMRIKSSVLFETRSGEEIPPNISQLAFPVQEALLLQEYKKRDSSSRLALHSQTSAAAVKASHSSR